MSPEEIDKLCNACDDLKRALRDGVINGIAVVYLANDGRARSFSMGDSGTGAELIGNVFATAVKLVNELDARRTESLGH